MISETVIKNFPSENVIYKITTFHKKFADPSKERFTVVEAASFLIAKNFLKSLPYRTRRYLAAL